MFLLDGSWREVVIETARVRAQFAEVPPALLGALDDPLVTDAVLFEGGAFAEFVATGVCCCPRTSGCWPSSGCSSTGRCTRSSASGRVRASPCDLRTGDVHQVRERTASHRIKPGVLVCARVVPAGETTQIFGDAEPPPCMSATSSSRCWIPGPIR